jgi:nucleoside-diphosphate-sugar epimerase
MENLHVSIVRPPLVYGPGVKGNFLRLMDLVARGIPLPLGMVTNRRSMVSTWNLCDLIRILASSAALPVRIWMASDGEDLSTPELISEVGKAMDREARLFRFPVPLLHAAAFALGKRAEFERLCTSLRVDITETRRTLHWHPTLSVAEGLQRTAAWYRVFKGL